MRRRREVERSTVEEFRRQVASWTEATGEDPGSQDPADPWPNRGLKTVVGAGSQSEITLWGDAVFTTPNMIERETYVALRP